MILTTGRLRLRPPVAGDAEVIFERYARDPEVTRYVLWAPHRSLDDTREFLRYCESGWATGTTFPWIIERAADRELLGSVELRITGHKADLGYVLAREAWGKGYATEAVRAVVEFAFAFPDVFRVWAVCDVRNTASARVLQKAGMEREGRLRRYCQRPADGEPSDVYCYAVVR